MDTPLCCTKVYMLLLCFGSRKHPPTPYMSGTFVLATPPPPPPDYTIINGMEINIKLRLKISFTLRGPKYLICCVYQQLSIINIDANIIAKEYETIPGQAVKALKLTCVLEARSEPARSTRDSWLIVSMSLLSSICFPSSSYGAW